MSGGPGGPAEDTLRFGERMTGVEALMWRLGRHDRRFQATMSLVVTLAEPVPVTGLRSKLSSLCRVVPRLRDRVRESPLGVVPPSWAPDPRFSVEHHVEEAPGDVWEAASSLVATPFDEGRPPWKVLLPSSSPCSVVLHLHHSYTDGLGGMRLLAELFDLEPAVGKEATGPPPGPHHAAGEAPAGPDHLESLLRDLEAEVRRAGALWSRAVPWAARTLAAAREDPAAVLRSAAELVSALQMHAGAAVGPASPLLVGRSGGAHLAPIDLDLGVMQGVARSLGLTVNDLFVAGLLDGLERYHAKHGSMAPALRLGLPISARRSESEMQNQVFGAVVRGPLGALDFVERARLVHEIVLLGRRQPWAALVEEAAEGAVRVPGMVRALAVALASLDVLASNVPGPPVPMWLAGVPIRSMTPVGPRSGSAVNATLLSYCGTASVGLNVDPAAVPDPGVLVDCLTSGFDEALGL